MTDAERLAKAWVEAGHMEWGGMVWGSADQWPGHIKIAQRLIDSGVVTVNSPPDPAEQIAKIMTATPGTWLDVARRLIDDMWITPGPRCDQ